MQPIHTPQRIPEFLEQMLIGQYGAETAAKISDGCIRRRPVTLRVNTLKAETETVKKALSDAGIHSRTAEWYGEALILEDVREPEVQRLDIYRDGQIYLQSLSSMIPPLFLSPQAGECILDMAAAPGGKTTQMAALSGGKAQITACEKNYARSQRLKYNLEKQGAGTVVVMNEDARKLDPFFSFDKVLLDAPCSGSGTGDVPRITKELIERSVRTQEALLRKALELLKPGHEMVYSTCSVLREENERILKKVLPGAKARVVPIEHRVMSYLPLLPAEMEGVCCICPTELYEGFFAAKIRKDK